MNSVMRRASATLLLWSAILWADPYPRQPDIDAIHYTFRLTLSDSTDEISGQGTADIRFLRDGIREFALDLAPTMTVSGAKWRACCSPTFSRSACVADCAACA